MHTKFGICRPSFKGSICKFLEKVFNYTAENILYSNLKSCPEQKNFGLHFSHNSNNMDQLIVKWKFHICYISEVSVYRDILVHIMFLLMKGIKDLKLSIDLI